MRNRNNEAADLPQNKNKLSTVAGIVKQPTTLLIIVLLSLLCLQNLAIAQDKPEIKIEDPTREQSKTYIIQGIDIVGVSKNKSFIIATSGLEEGKQIRIPGNAIPDAIKTLTRTGLFSDVKIYITQKLGNSVFLEIIVKEQPRLDGYEIKRIKKSERKEINEIMPSLAGFTVTEATKSQAVNTIVDYFQEKGYREVDVEIMPVITDTARNRVKLIFLVNKGDKIELEKIFVEGNETLSDKKVKKQLKPLKEDRWYRIFGATLFKKDEFVEGKENLLTSYREKGYRDVRILKDSVYLYTQKSGKKGLGVYLSIYEGPKYFIRNIDWNGNTVYTDEQLTESLGFTKGDVFNQTKFDQNLYINKNNTDVSSLYQDIGYLFMQVFPNIKVIGTDSLDLRFNIMEDEIARIQEVDFTGNTRTHDNVVRRNLRTIPGAKYSRTNIQRSIRELSTLSYFVPESIMPELDYDYEDKTVSVFYRMEEIAGTDNFEFQGGYGGGQIGLILSARLNFNNFSIQNVNKKDAWTPLPSGDGQRLSLGIQVTGGGYQTYDVSFQEPWLMGRPNSLGVSVSYALYKTSNSRDEVFSTSLSYGRRLKWPDDYFTHTSVLQYQAYNVFGSVFNQEGNVYVLTIKQILERNSLDNFISPTSGSKITLTGSIAPPFADFSQYYKLQFKFQYHIPVIGKLTFTNGSELGHLGYFGEKMRTPFERFYLGGTPLQQRQTFTRDNIDLLGYPGGSAGSISPINEVGSFVGGTFYVKYLTELRYPLVQNEQLQLIPYMFGQAGNVFADFKDVAPFNVKRSAGFGMRFFLPILGLIDLSYGYRFDGIPNTQVNSGNWEFLFNIGPAF